jgi:hypothetical protein
MFERRREGDTQVSFANQVASWLTSGICTPMEVKVVCAQ